MSFKKGTSGNPSGRPKGAKTKSTLKLREWINEVIDENRETILFDLAQLESKDRLSFLMKMMDYVLPKPKEEGQKETTNHLDLIQETIRQLNEKDNDL